MIVHCTHFQLWFKLNRLTRSTLDYVVEFVATRREGHFDRDIAIMIKIS